MLAQYHKPQQFKDTSPVWKCFKGNMYLLGYSRNASSALNTIFTPVNLVIIIWLVTN